MEREPQQFEPRFSTEKWNEFTIAVQKTLEAIRPRDNPEVVNACKKYGISEREILEVHEKLGKIFDACYSDATGKK